MRALAANRQTSTMTKSSIATDLHEALHVLGYLAMKITLNLEVVLDVITKLCQIFFCHVLDANIGIDSRCCKDLFGRCQTNSVDVGQGNLDALVLRKVYTD